MKFWFLLILIFTFSDQDDVPMLTADEFSYELEYFLKQKQSRENKVYDVTDKSRSSTDVLPFVQIHFSFPSFRVDDKRIRVYQGKKVLNSQKIKGPLKIKLDLGFAVDLKEGAIPSTFNIYIINEDKERRGRIKVEVKPNGELLINEVPSGMI